VGHQRLFDLRKSLEEARDEEMSRLRVGGDVVGHRAGQMSRHRDVGDVELPRRLRQTIVHQHRPVDVEREVRRRDGGHPRGSGECNPAQTGLLLSNLEPHLSAHCCTRRMSVSRINPSAPINSMPPTTRSYRLPAFRASMMRYPRPESTAIISAATSTSQATPKAMRSPTAMRASAAGATTRSISCGVDSPKFRPACRN